MKMTGLGENIAMHCNAKTPNQDLFLQAVDFVIFFLIFTHKVCEVFISC